MDKYEMRRVKAKKMLEEMTVLKELAYTVYDLNGRMFDELDGKRFLTIVPRPYDLTDLTFEPEPGFTSAHTFEVQAKGETSDYNFKNEIASKLFELKNSERWGKFWVMSTEMEEADLAWREFAEKDFMAQHMKAEQLPFLARNCFIGSTISILKDRKKLYESSGEFSGSAEGKYRRFGAIAEIDNLIEILDTIKP